MDCGFLFAVSFRVEGLGLSDSALINAVFGYIAL